MTPIQHSILKFIADETERAWPPSIREIGAAVGLKSASNVHRHLKALERMGCLRRQAGRHRSLKIVETNVREKG